MGASSGNRTPAPFSCTPRKPLPISASLACVSARMMEVLPLCTLPSSQTTGANWRARSAMGVCVSAAWLIACPWIVRWNLREYERFCNAYGFARHRAL